MELFTIAKKQGWVIYHATSATKTPFNLQNKPTWFAHTTQDAKRYADDVYSFTLNKDLKLIDISNQLFHLDFIAKINNESAPTLTTGKLNPLIALGLPDYKSQLKVTGYREKGTYPNISNDTKMLHLIDLFIPLFGHKHRFSVQGSSLNTDKDLVDALMRHYPDFDGYICQNMWPSYHHGGFLAPETCLFKPVQCVSIGSLLQAGGRRTSKKSCSQVGGQNDTLNHFDLHEYLAANQMKMDDILVGRERFANQWASTTAVDGVER